MTKQSDKELTRVLVRGYISDRKFVIELAGVGGFICLVLATLKYQDYHHDKFKSDIFYFVGLITINALLVIVFERHKSRRKDRPERDKLKEAIQVILGDEEIAERIIANQNLAEARNDVSLNNPAPKSP